MSENVLFERIQAVRTDLTQNHDYGALNSERYLIANGDLLGQWFCFEKADIKWRFDSDFAEIWRDGQLEGTFSLDASIQENLLKHPKTDLDSKESLPKAA